MKANKILCIIFLFLMNSCFLFAQENSSEDFPVVGKRCPDFILKNIGYYSLKQASLNDFKGKWLILDFFSTGCEICFARMPKVNAMQKEFKGKVQIVMVGKDDRYIRTYYEKFRQHYGLTMPIVYDTVLFKQFQILQVPYAVWIDDEGIVRAVTSGIEKKQVQDFLSRNPVNNLLFRNITQKNEIENYYDFNKPLLINHNGGADTSFLFRSLLAKWDPKSSFWFDYFISSASGNQVQMTGICLNFFYNLAYGDTVPFTYSRFRGQPDSLLNHYGQWKFFPVLEMRDTSLFQFDENTGKNLFSYSLIVPLEKANPRYLQQTMQRDLFNYFGYEVKVEKRLEPYYRITATPEAKHSLMTKGGKPVFDGSFIHVSMQNMSMVDLIADITGFHQRIILCDETGIKGNIDLKFDAVLTDLNDIKRALLEKGLLLEEGLKEMNVIVIRDPAGKTPDHSWFR